MQHGVHLGKNSTSRADSLKNVVLSLLDYENSLSQKKVLERKPSYQ